MAAFISSPLPGVAARPRLLRRSPQRLPCRLQTCTPRASAFDFDSFADMLRQGQTQLCKQVEAIDGHAAFGTDPWTGSNGGGLTRVLQNGAVFEKGGINVSFVHGTLSEARAKAMSARGREVAQGTPYRAAALSLVLHTMSPFLPTLRADVRVFAAGDKVWAGGGADLTPFYIHRPSFAAFHAHWRDELARFDPSWYEQFKVTCDEYFFIPSRGERRGVGGVFYDDLELPGDALMALQHSVLQGLLPSYEPALKAASGEWNEEQKRWQRIRRARYIEFNLLFDRGVKFGLAGAPPSRTDAILISAPPSVEWPYGFRPDPGSPEAELVALLEGPPVDWAAEHEA